MVHIQKPGERDKHAIFCPNSLRAKALHDSHVKEDSGHNGSLKLAHRIINTFWWPGVYNQAEDWVKHCHICQMARKQPVSPTPLRMGQIVPIWGYQVHTDLLGPLKSCGDKKYLLTITDRFSKYIEIVALKTKESTEVAKQIYEKWFLRHGMPKILTSDRGLEFTNQILRELCTLMNVDQLFTTAGNPKANSIAESENRNITKFCTKFLDDNSTAAWEDLIVPLQFHINTSYHKGTKEIPFFMTYLRDPKLPSSNLYQKPDDIHNDWVREKLTEYWETYERVHENLLEAAQKSKDYTDNKRGAKEKKFQVGMEVMLHWPAIKVGQNKKFTSQWMPGWKIKEVVSDKNVIITHEDGKRQQLVHVDRLKPYFLPKFMQDNETKTKDNPKQKEKETSEKIVTSEREHEKPKPVSQTARSLKNRDQKKPKKYPGLPEDVLKFTSSYFDNDKRENSRYNLRRVNRVNYNT